MLEHARDERLVGRIDRLHPCGPVHVDDGGDAVGPPRPHAMREQHVRARQLAVEDLARAGGQDHRRDRSELLSALDVVEALEVVGPRGVGQQAAVPERSGPVLAAALEPRDDAVGRAQQLVARNRELEKELAALRAKLASGQGSDLASQAVEVEGLKVIAARVDGADAGALRDAVDRLKNKLGSGVVVLGSVDAGKVRLAAGATKDVSKKVPAGKLVNSVAEQVGGRGGGRPDFAQAGGSEPDKLDAALESVRDWVAAQLKE